MEFLIGIFVGALLYYAFTRPKKPVGSFIIDFSDPMKDVCRLELVEDINDIYAMKSIVLKVKTVRDISQD